MNGWSIALIAGIVVSVILAAVVMSPIILTLLAVITGVAQTP